MTALRNFRRMPGWAAGAAGLLGLLAWLSPPQVEVLLFKLSLVTLALLLGYLADRSLFARAPRVDSALPPDVYGGARLLARALVVLAVILGVTMGI